ncbi:class I SAM-dependent methyltransferase [Calothrix sp. UHCC 0171]|uniref:class I SAM-dependent DNA methyltransferase n=1 Tax=Calothrix sp. UHCC 0171 TaxID=3110245 RepID=UPI002B1FC0B3|nr:class I SAM-dependent methyltransferase [Calothrix sp. UHCC 0171]MEA5573955.1 class I SAM-dependent methyltransferase [Calothrix sp. UHCC 0171]
MSVFGNYARYYDLLYRDKDYLGEAQFIHRLIKTHAPNAHSILELGCGTGNHAVLLAKEGYQIHGVDFSQEMLQKADSRLSQLPPDLTSRLQFSQGDIRQVRLNQTFDIILSLFHVISYQTTNKDLLAAFATVKEHLKPGGIFIFDVWYGPAVLTEQPTVRVKRLEDEEIIVTRIAEPVLHPNKNLVDVNYQVFIRDKRSNTVEEIQENHHMRYLFKPEIDHLLSANQMQNIKYCEWMTDREAGLDTWGVCFIVQKDG